MIIRAAFFDLDGTLVDSLQDLTDAVNHIRGSFSLSPLTEGEVRLKVGKGARNLIEQVLSDHSAADVSQALDMFLEFNARHIADKSRLYPGILEALNELAARDIKMVVISNKHEDLSRLILRELGIHDRFENICGGNTYPEYKPSPLPLLKETEKLGLSPFQCVMVGDSINDIVAGKLANITSIACTWGYGNRDELAGADCFVHTPQELQTAITSFGRLP